MTLLEVTAQATSRPSTINSPMQLALETVGRRIKLLRERKGLSQEKLAADCGLYRTAIGNIEGGRVSTKISTLVVIAHHLGTTAQNLLKDIDPFD